MSGGILGQSQVGGAIGSWWVEARDAADHLTSTGQPSLHTKNYPAPRSIVPRLSNLSQREWMFWTEREAQAKMCRCETTGQVWRGRGGLDPTGSLRSGEHQPEGHVGASRSIWALSRKLRVWVFFFFNWRLITLQYCSRFCHTLTWISHGCTCVPYPEPPSHLPPHPIRLGRPSTPAPSTLYQGLMLKLQYFGHLMWRADSLEKTVMLGKIEGKRRRGQQDKMVG